MKKDCKVCLVGAGPGDPELITLRALKAIQTADAILFDALANDQLLEYAKKSAKLIPVGKRCGQHSMTQDEINLTIVQTAFQYGNVVRLKGGDPFIFGRGHEELEYIRAFDIPIVIIPGICSATSLPLLQEVPLTKRNISESFWVITGTTKQHKLSADIGLAAQSTATIVILMGLRKLRDIIQIFQSTRQTETPVMIILNGSCYNEKVLIGTTDDIINRFEEESIDGPGIIVIGEVVSLHPHFAKEYAIQNQIT